MRETGPANCRHAPRKKYSALTANWMNSGAVTDGVLGKQDLRHLSVDVVL